MPVPGNKPSQRPTSGTRSAVLDAVGRSEQPVTVQEIAEELTLHTNSVRFHLSRLLQTGLVREEQADPDGPGRPRMVYTAVPVPPAGTGSGASGGTAAAPGSAPSAAPGSTATAQEGKGYQFLAEMLAGHLAATSPDPRATAAAVGEAWGRYLADRPVPFSCTTQEESIAQVIAILDRAGFSPAAQKDGYRLDLRTCPFRTVADHQPGVVCSVHLGLMRGVLEEMNAPVEVVGLDRFEAPYPCVARLQAITDGPGDGPAADGSGEVSADEADEATQNLPGWAEHLTG